MIKLGIPWGIGGRITRYLTPPGYFSWKMQEGGHLMHPEVKLGVSGGRPDAFTVLSDVWKCTDISHMGTEGIFIINTSNFLNFPSFSCYIIRWHPRLWPPAYRMTRWCLLSWNLLKMNLLEVEGTGRALWASGEEDIMVSSRSHRIENVNIIIST